MTDTPTIRCRWTGGALLPVGNYAMAAACDVMSEGDTVLVSIDHPRSMNSHRHQFAEINTMFHHIPERLQDMPWAASPDTLRKHALIACGFHSTYTLDCGGKATAERVKAALVSAEAGKHGYAIGQVRGPVVTIWTPMSQSVRAMGGAEFQRSKQAVLDWCEATIGVTLEQAESAA